MAKFFPYLKICAFGFIAIASAYFFLSQLRNALPGGKGMDPLASPLADLVPSLGGDGSEAVDIAIHEMTRVSSLYDRPPEGGEALGRTADERFWIVQLDLGPNRQSILCVVEPEAANTTKKLVHFELAGKEPTQRQVQAAARQGTWKASANSDWSFYGASPAASTNLAEVFTL